MSIFKDQEDFITKAGQGSNARLYADLIKEESGEFLETQESDYIGSSIDEIKEAVDVIVVSAGFLVSLLGAEKAQQAWNLVFEANMAKLHGVQERREDGKVLPNADYKKLIKEKLNVSLLELSANKTD